MLDRDDQIAQAHAPLILAVVQACRNPALRRQMEPILAASADNGWTDLVAVIRQLLDGRREVSLLQGLDPEDRAIVGAMLRGLADPANLPEVNRNGLPQGDPAAAGPGLASIVQAASSGDTDALRWLGEMADQMAAAGGPMARVGAALGPLARGERDPAVLCAGMDGSAEQLVLDILAELGRSQNQ